MTGMAMFQSELRSAVREVRDAPVSRAVSQPGPANTLTPARPTKQLVPAGGPPDAAAKRTVVRLWLPLTLLWILLAPFALLLAPALLLVPQARGVRPYRTALALGATLLALSGAYVDVDTRDALVRIRIF